MNSSVQRCTTTDDARDYALIGGGSGMIARGWYLVHSWGNQRTRYALKSTTKSIGGSALGLAIADNFLPLHEHAQHYLPTIGIPPDGNAATGWLDGITLVQLATHTAGFAKPGGYISLLYEPGTTWSYSDGSSITAKWKNPPSLGTRPGHNWRSDSEYDSH